MITVDVVGTLHDTLSGCLKDNPTCNVAELQASVDRIEDLYNSSKIDNFKLVTKTTPGHLYDLLRPQDDINAAIVTAAREILSYAPGIKYEGDTDAVDDRIFNGNAAMFLDDAAVEAILSILTVHALKSYPPNYRYNWVKLPRLVIGGHKRRRATKVRGRTRRTKHTCMRRAKTKNAHKGIN